MAAPVQPVPDQTTQPPRPRPPRPPAPVPGQPAAPRPPVPGQPAAGATYAPVNPVQPTPPMAPGSATSTAQNAALGQLQAAQNGPDRQALATQTFQNIVSSGEPAFQQGMRQIGSNAAKYGRIGAGLTTNELTDYGLARQRTLDTTASQLATDAAGQTMADRMALANAALGQYSAFSGADQASNELALKDRLGTGQLALDTELGRGNLGVNQGRLGLDTTRAAQDYELGKGSLDLNKTKAAQDYELGTGRLGLDTTRAAQDFALGKESNQTSARSVANQYELGSGRLGLDTTTAANDARLAEARNALDRELGVGRLGLDTTRAANDYSINLGNLGLDRTRVENQASQFGQDFGERQLTNDRNFALDDRTAAALAALEGIDQTNSGDGTSAYNLPTVTGGAGTNPVVMGNTGNPYAPIGTDRERGITNGTASQNTGGGMAPAGVNPANLDPAALQNADPVALNEYIRQGLASGQLDQRTADAMRAMAQENQQ